MRWYREKMVTICTLAVSGVKSNTENVTFHSVTSND